MSRVIEKIGKEGQLACSYTDKECFPNGELQM